MTCICKQYENEDNPKLCSDMCLKNVRHSQNRPVCRNVVDVIEKTRTCSMVSGVLICIYS